MSTSSNTHELPSLSPYTGPGITLETKLMHQYRLASPVDTGIEGVAVRNADGQVELFTVGTDGTVWNFSPAEGSDTGYLAVKTGLHARKATMGGRIAAGLDHDGSIVAFVRGPYQGGQVSYATKSNGVWLSAALANLPDEYTGSGMSTLGTIYDIRARNIDGQLYVALVGRIMGGGPTYLAVTNWSSTPGVFKSFTQQDAPNPPVSQWPSEMSVGTGFWTHTESSPTPAFSIFAPTAFGNRFQGFVTLDVNCKLTEYISSAGGLPNIVSAAVDIESPVDSVGRNKIYAIASGCLYQFTHGKVIKDPLRYISYDWPALSYAPPKLRKVHAVHDHKGDTHLFCISEDNCLYHLTPDLRAPAGFRPLGLPIKKGVQWIALARNDDGDIELFFLQTSASASLVHMTLDQDSGDWEEQPIEIEAPIEADNKLEEFISYSTDIALTDSCGAPLANAAVTIRASDRTSVTVNNATFAVDATGCASVTADEVGKLTITHQTSGLSVPDLWLNIAPLMPDYQVLVLQQYANGRDDKELPDNMKSIQARLTNVRSDELANAKDAKGNYLLSKNYRSNEKFTKTLATACHQCMRLAGSNTVAAALHPMISRKGTWTGLHVESMAAAHARSRVLPSGDLPSWSLSFEGGEPDYQTLTPEQAEEAVAAMRAHAGLYTDAGGRSMWSTIGDFFESILDGIVTITKLVVNGVKATFTFVIGTVTYMFDAVVKFVQDSFDMLESILATVYDSVTDFFKRTFEWIGFLLNWDDIKRTQEALSHVFEEMLGFMKKAGPSMKVKVDGAFAEVQGKIASAFDELIAKTSGKSFGGLVKDNERHDPVAAHALGNNVAGNAFAGNWKSAKVPASPVFNTAGSNDLLRAIEQYSEEKEKEPAWKNTSDYLARTASPDQFFTEALTGFFELLKKLSLAVVAGAQTIIDKLLDELAGMVDALHAMLVKEVQIPLLSELFKSKVGKPLSAMNLMALIAAIPTTVLYKAIKGAAPFPDDASVTAFKSTFTAQWMLNAAGLESGHPNGLAVAMSAKDRLRMQLACGVMTFLYGNGTAALNWISAQNTILHIPDNSRAFQFCSGVAFAFELAIQSCSFPLCLEENPSRGSYGLWGYQCVGVVLDGVFILKDGVLPQNVADGFYPAAMAGLFGLGDLSGYAIKGVKDWGDAAGVLVSLAECLNWLLLNKILRGPWGQGAAAVAAVGTSVLYTVAGGIQFFTAKDGFLQLESDHDASITLAVANA